MNKVNITKGIDNSKYCLRLRLFKEINSDGSFHFSEECIISSDCYALDFYFAGESLSFKHELVMENTHLADL